MKESPDSECPGGIMMKTKNVAVGFLVAGFAFVLMSVLIANKPSGSMDQSQLCHFEPRQCAVPQNLSGFNMFPQ